MAQLPTAAVAEQALFSSATFSTTLILGHYSAPRDFAAFSALFVVFIVLSRFHQALILDPLSVYAGTRYAKHRSQYFLSATALHWKFTFLAALIAFPIAAAWTASLGQSCLPALTAALGTPIVLRFWLTRRICYTRFQPRTAMIGTAAYLASLLTLVFVLHSRAALTPATVWASLACSAALGTLVAEFPRFLSRSQHTQLGRHLTLYSVARRHLWFGKWGAAFTLLDFATDAVYLPLVTMVVGSNGTALYRASEVPFLPAQQLLSALVLFYMPRLAQVLRYRPITLVRHYAFLAAIGAASLAAVYTSVVALAGSPVIAVIFPDALYRGIFPLLPLVGGWLVIRTVGEPASGTVLRAAGLPKLPFLGACVGALLTCMVGIPLTCVLGLKGALIGRVISSAGLSVTVLALTFTTSGVTFRGPSRTGRLPYALFQQSNH
jgi:hypothetical protein